MKLFKDYAVLASGQVASRVLGLLAFAWLARALNPQAYGAVEYVIGLTLLGGTLIDGGSSLVGVRRARQTPAKLASLGSQILRVRLIFTAITVPVVAAVGLWTTSSVVPRSLVWLFAASLLLAPWRHEWMLQAAGRTGEIAWAQVVRAAVFAALAWSLVRGPADVIAAGWAEVAAIAALTGYCIYIQHTRIAPFRLKGPMEGFSALARESAAAGVTNALWTLTQYAPLLMIGALIGGAQTAWYAASARVIGSLLVVPYVYHFGLYPAVVHAAQRRPDLVHLLNASCRVTAWMGVFLALALTLLARALVVLIMGAKLEPSAPMLQIMAWVLPVSMCAGHAVALLAARGAQTRLLWSRLIALGTVVVAGLSLGPALEGIGYAIAALASAIALWVAAHVSAAKLGLQPPPFGLALKPVGLAAVLFVLARATDSGAGLLLLWLSLYALAAPILDRGLLSAFSTLGRATLGTSTPMSTMQDEKGVELPDGK